MFYLLDLNKKSRKMSHLGAKSWKQDFLGAVFIEKCHFDIKLRFSQNDIIQFHFGCGGPIDLKFGSDELWDII